MRREKGRLLTKYDKVQQKESTEEVSNLNGSLYAILFNANEGVHSHDLELVYNSLINADVPDLDILALEGDGITKKRFVDKAATIRNLDSAIDSIRQKANKNDKLLVYVTNHGNLVNGQRTFDAYDGKIWEKDFEQMIQDLPINFGLFYFAQCYSGGFAERVGYGRNIGMANANRKEMSYGKFSKKRGSNFTHYLFPSILNHDLTIEQVFDEAVRKDTGFWEGIIHPTSISLQNPQLMWQNADPSKLYLTSPFS
jgi:hypothetical protein